MININNKFKCNFQFNITHYIDDNLDCFFIPKKDNNESNIVELTNKATLKTVILIIDRGYNINMCSSNKTNPIITMPNPNFFIINFGNIGYIVNGNRPEEFQLINDNPIKDIYQDDTNNQVIIFFENRIIAYNVENNIKWHIDLHNLVNDGYDIKSKNDINIILEHYDDRDDLNKEIVLNNIDGNIQVS